MLEELVMFIMVFLEMNVIDFFDIEFFFFKRIVFDQLLWCFICIKYLLV